LTGTVRPCKALLFDMDGVLVDSRAIVERTWRRWAERHGIDVEPLLRIAHGRRPEDTLQAAVPHLAVAEEVAWLQAAELADFDGLIAIPGAAQLLAGLSGVPWAVVTSAGPELARRRLVTAGLPVPAVIVSSTDVSRGKPAPEGYLLAAARLGVHPTNAIVFEDAPAGVSAGLAAGCAVIGVATSHTAEQLAGAAGVVPDLTSVRVHPEAGCWRIEIQPYNPPKSKSS
jgi:mannitol-1-/sugar-/sorbitol-6-phosphatase